MLTLKPPPPPKLTTADPGWVTTCDPLPVSATKNPNRSVQSFSVDTATDGTEPSSGGS
jgi:hypothetical protein